MADEITKLAKIEDVTHDEIEIINKRRKRLYPKQDVSESSETNLVGLALSGGGIRSGVTNLGVLYEMSRVGLFRIVDYLSTVSGGGYIGCCVSSLLSLKKPDADPISGNAVYTYNKGDSDSSLFSTSWSSFPFRDLPIEGRANGQETDNGGYGEDTAYCGNYTSRDQVFHLRDRASYLIPSSLPFGSHVIRAMGAVGASTLLSLAWFFSLLVFITTLYMFIAFPAWKTPDPVAAPHAVEEQVLSDTGSTPKSKKKPIQPEKGSPEKKGATESKSESDKPAKDPSKSKPEASKSADGIMNRASKAMSEIKIKLLSQIEAFSEFSQSKWIVLFAGIVWGLLAPFCMHWRGQKIDAGKRIGEDRENFIGRAQLKCISLATIPLLVAVLIVSWFLIQGKFSVPDARLLFPVVFAIGCLVGSFIMLCLLAGNLLSFSSGKMSNDVDSGDKPDASGRLAWNRISRAELALCSGIFVYCLAGSYIFAALPAFILSGNAGFIAFIQAGAILVLRYYLSAKKKKNVGIDQGGFTAFLSKLSKWLLGMVVPVVVLLAIIGIASFLGRKFFGAGWPGTIGPANFTCILSVLAGAGLLSIAFSFLNFNRISPHVFYKDRLAEAFLATFMRHVHYDNKTGNKETRMDLARNSVEMRLADLHGNEPREEADTICAARGPYLLINATLNLTAARDLQGFRRQSQNFLFSKCYTGSERTGYMATSAYNPPIALDRAMTISGAALTSVMGAQGSLAESFACTILGVRLGYWLRNPVDLAKTLQKRIWNWKNLYYELFRYTDTRDSHVYLSDGGHCGDNLGLLALLQRKTKLIIASDAECDPEHVFDSLNNSIRRAYIDYSIKVHISLDDLIPEKKDGFTRKHYVIGRVLYPDRPWQKSWLLVIKNTMTGKESSPIRNYHKKSPAFPHETTADQFFTEEQFEVYRSLGREACVEIWRENIDIFRSEEWLRNPWSCIDTFCQALADEPHKWDDVIRAIWSSERGDFNTWQGFMDTIEEINSSGHKDDSIMVHQLHTLYRWLMAHKQDFNRLGEKYDVPRTWEQFKHIRNQVIHG